MDKLKVHTPDRTEENFRKLAEMFPNAVTEMIDENGEVVRAIDMVYTQKSVRIKLLCSNFG